MLGDLTQVIQTTPISRQNTAEDANWWKMKYEKLEEQYLIMKARNEELEERMLNVVEKVESDKIVLSDEIDHLSARLAASNGRIVALERDCARYKKDCVLAVHLLHCKPSNYVDTKTAPEGLFVEQMKKPKVTSVVRGVTTFPPMAVYVPDEECEVQPEDPSPTNKSIANIASDPEIPTLRTSASFTSEFVDRIQADEEYSCVELRRCEKCETIVTAISRETQTPIAQPPRPKIVDTPPRHFSDCEDFI